MRRASRDTRGAQVIGYNAVVHRLARSSRIAAYRVSLSLLAKYLVHLHVRLCFAFHQAVRNRMQLCSCAACVAHARTHARTHSRTHARTHARAHARARTHARTHAHACKKKRTPKNARARPAHTWLETRASYRSWASRTHLSAAECIVITKKKKTAASSQLSGSNLHSQRSVQANRRGRSRCLPSFGARLHGRCDGRTHMRSSTRSESSPSAEYVALPSSGDFVYSIRNS